MCSKQTNKNSLFTILALPTTTWLHECFHSRLFLHQPLLARMRVSQNTESPSIHTAQALACFLTMCTRVQETVKTRDQSKYNWATGQRRLHHVFIPLLHYNHLAPLHRLYIFSHASSHPKVCNIYSQFHTMKTQIVACNTACINTLK